MSNNTTSSVDYKDDHLSIYVHKAMVTDILVNMKRGMRCAKRAWCLAFKGPPGTTLALRRLLWRATENDPDSDPAGGNFIEEHLPRSCFFFALVMNFCFVRLSERVEWTNYSQVMYQSLHVVCILLVVIQLYYNWDITTGQSRLDSTRNEKQNVIFNKLI